MHSDAVFLKRLFIIIIAVVSFNALNEKLQHYLLNEKFTRTLANKENIDISEK